jgi:ubiquinone/menaquinone biosynthesis C-methylase UbiE
MLVVRGLKLGFDIQQGSIECIPSVNESFDVAYARHILEHLNYYEKAVSELIRVARYETLIVFFIKPIAEEDRINSTMIDGALLYHNAYNKEKLERFVTSHQKVKEVSWEHVTDKEVLLHIYMKQEGCV